MKKLYTLLLAAAAMSTASAADFQLLFGDTPVVNDATYERGYEIQEQDDALTVYDQSANLYLKGTKGTKYSVTVVTDNPILACPFTECFNLSKGQSRVIEGVLDTDQPKNLMIHQESEGEGVHNPADIMKTITVNVSVCEASKPFDSSDVTVVIYNKPQSEIGLVAAVNANNDVISMADGRTLRFSTAKASKLELFSTSGVNVYSARLNGTGTIKLSSLAPGVYAYRFNGLRGKILVK